ncbi:MAG: cell division protein FtsL [Ignavibacteria bacterium]|nr:cell division protein FtsL [Ignavibacteria bacterium]
MFIAKKTYLKIFFVILAFAVFIILYVDNVIRIRKITREKYQIEKRLEEIQNENAILDKKINELRSPERIITFAQEKLKMKLPQKAPKK